MQFSEGKQFGANSSATPNIFEIPQLLLLFEKEGKRAIMIP